ncbi:MAG TPA: ribosome biogenesis factor YjgA [Steroidobacteraceae bacterium]|nr:ribosome biogenesis factor YjgA [Steroidobacteraceae bacterium]
MQEDEDSGEFEYDGPSRSQRKREAEAAQALGTRLIELKESELRALNLPDTLLDALLLAKRITARGGLARQRQYIGKLMRGIDLAPVEAALAEQSRTAKFASETHKRLETWRARLLTEGPEALDDLLKWCPAADRKALQSLIAKATSQRVDSGSREAASRELFRTLRGLFDSISR